MPMYLTHYHLPDGTRQTTQCWAKDDQDLEAILVQRGMGEVRHSPEGQFGLNFYPEVPKLASELLMEGRLAEAMHALIWTSMVGCRAGVVDGWRLLNDHGVIHQLAHALHTEKIDGSHRALADAGLLIPEICQLERSVPGAHPSWSGDEVKPVEARDPFHEHFDRLINEMAKVMAVPRRMIILEPEPVEPAGAILEIKLDFPPDMETLLLQRVREYQIRRNSAAGPLASGQFTSIADAAG